MELQPSDILAAILDRQRRGKSLSKAEKDFLRNRDRGWLGNAMDNIRNALSNSVPAFLGRAFRSLTDPFRYAGELMFQGNPAGRAAGLSNYWSPNPITAGGYTGKGGGFPGRGPTASGTITSAPRPVNTPRVSRSPLGQPQFKFPKGSGGVRGMVTQTADNAAVSALGRKAANTMGRKLGRAVPFVGAAIAVADATSRISNGDYGGAILSAASAIPGPLGWIALGTQMVTDGLGATGNRREEYIIETKTKDTFRDEFQQMGGFDIEPGDWGAAFLDELAKTNQIKDDEKAIIAAVFSGEDEGLMITDLQETLGKIMVRIANKEYKGKKPDVQETISEERKTNILKNLKNPVVLPESKKKHKVKPGQRYKGKTNFQGMDKLIGDIKPQEPFKKERSAWSKDWQGYNAKLSQNKKNQVLELVGDGKHYFDYMLNDSKIKNAEEMEKFWGLHPELYSYVMGGKKYKATRKEQVRGDYLVFLTDENGEKTSMLQSDISIKLEEEHQKEMIAEYNKTAEPTPFLKDPLMKKVAKRLKNEIDYPDKPAKKGYPDEPPPKQVDGWHPEYGKKYKYDKLDPVSAVMMKRAPTGDPEIDANVKKASMKPKVEKKSSNWREELEKENKLKNELSESDWTPVTSTIANRATQTFQHISGTTATFAGLGGVEVHPSTVTIYGDDVSTPSYSDLALAGYAKPLGMGRRDDYEDVNPKLDASQEFAQNVGADVMMNARVTGSGVSKEKADEIIKFCLLYTSPSPRDRTRSRMPSSA